ncbi:MAG: endonuclease/exonuclease/phosphatase family protein [Candidatus Thorarchaeota archaeon]|nr:endonuclease/exonuclease/phosphatase family protein [Candidatus Thorarchaeota archaeon]
MVSRNTVIGGVVLIVIVASIAIVYLAFQTPGGDIPTGDTTPPVLTVNIPQNGSSLFGAVALSFSAVDESAIPRYEVYIDGEIVAVGQAYNWNTGQVSDGSHTIMFRARDDSQNWGQSTVTVTVNNTAIPEYEFDGIFKIMSYNIEESGINADWKEVVKEENPDILMLVETGYLEDNGYAGLRQVIGEFNTYFIDELPYSGLAALNVAFSTSGEAILSRYPILQFVQIPVVTLDSNQGYTVTHDFVHAVIDINGTAVNFIGAHLKAGGGSDNQVRREFENEGIINYMDTLGEVPIVYLGDLNSYSPEDNVTVDEDLGYGPLTMLVDPDDATYGQYSSAVHNFTDVFRSLNPDEIGYTYGHQYAPLLGRIDYIIVNSFFTDKLINSTAGGTAHANTGSDHYSIDFFVTWDGTGAVVLPGLYDSSSSKTDNNAGVRCYSMRGSLNFMDISQRTAEDRFGLLCEVFFTEIRRE